MTLQQEIVVYSSHTVVALLGQLQTQHLTSARQNRYEIYLLNNPHLTFRHCTTLNPATFIESPPLVIEKPDHDCLHSVLEDTSPRSDLSDTPLLNSDLVMFTDGSSSINKEGTTLESGAFQVPLSAQQTELFALTRACILGEDLRVNIYTDSRYAFGVVHDFGQLWKNRGFLTSTGTPISNQVLVSDLLLALLLPRQIAVIKCSAHTAGSSPIDIGNRRADEAAKCAARSQQIVVPRMMRQTSSSKPSLSAPEKPMPTIKEVLRLQEDTPAVQKQLWNDLDCKYDTASGLWITPTGQTCMSDELALWVIECVHYATHCGAKATSDLLLQTWWHPSLKMFAQNIISRCLTCQRHNPGRGGTMFIR
uniref:uncharacterized protein n=1 Tax=Pristiophorus japonicus TaxID=55135 RepID=UPI00398F6B54